MRGPGTEKAQRTGMGGRPPCLEGTSHCVLRWDASRRRASRCPTGENPEKAEQRGVSTCGHVSAGQPGDPSSSASALYAVLQAPLAATHRPPDPGSPNVAWHAGCPAERPRRHRRQQGRAGSPAVPTLSLGRLPRDHSAPGPASSTKGGTHIGARSWDKALGTSPFPAPGSGPGPSPVRLQLGCEPPLRGAGGRAGQLLTNLSACTKGGLCPQQVVRSGGRGR